MTINHWQDWDAHREWAEKERKQELFWCERECEKELDMVETKEEKIRAILGQLAGAASLCWEPQPSGVFDSTTAATWVEEAFQKIKGLEIETI